MEIKILSCFHKEFDKPKSDVIYPIHVGKANSNIELNIMRDDINKNISEKNKNYCELTAVYWAWKNVECDIIGLTHYRRYFDLNKSNYELRIHNSSILKSDIFRSYGSKIEDIISSGYDIIIPQKKVFDMSVRDQYIKIHRREDIEILESIINRKYPEYMESYDYIMNKCNKLSLYNMFIMKKDEFDKYCEWLFDILFELESNVQISNCSYQARIFGFISERLLNVYVYHNKLRIKYKPVIFIDNNDISRKNSILKEKISYLKKEIKFRL